MSNFDMLQKKTNGLVFDGICGALIDTNKSQAYFKLRYGSLRAAKSAREYDITLGL